MVVEAYGEYLEIVEKTLIVEKTWRKPGENLEKTWRKHGEDLEKEDSIYCK